MSFASASTSLSTAQARAEAVGYLALAYTGKRLPLQVRHGAAGHQTRVDHKGATGQPLTASGPIALQAALLARLGLLGTFRQFHEFSFTESAQSVPRRVR